MSSLAAAQADGYYIPPDFHKSKAKTINEYTKSKGHNQFVQKGIVRFELPYDGICLNSSCKQTIRRGTRFNASKKEVGSYYTSKIWEFCMKCRRCGECDFLIRTNPRERMFDYVQGIKIKAQDSSVGVIDTDIGNGIISFSNIPHHEKASAGALSGILALEKSNDDYRKAQEELDHMDSLAHFQTQHMLHDADSNSKLRSIFRKDRKAKRKRLQDASHKGLGKGIELVDSQDAVDPTLSDKIFKTSLIQSTEFKERAKRKEKKSLSFVRNQSIFYSKQKNHHHSKNASSCKFSPTKGVVSLKRHYYYHHDGTTPSQRQEILWPVSCQSTENLTVTIKTKQRIPSVRGTSDDMESSSLALLDQYSSSSEEAGSGDDDDQQ